MAWSIIGMDFHHFSYNRNSDPRCFNHQADPSILRWTQSSKLCLMTCFEVMSCQFRRQDCCCEWSPMDVGLITDFWEAHLAWRLLFTEASCNELNDGRVTWINRQCHKRTGYNKQWLIKVLWCHQVQRSFYLISAYHSHSWSPCCSAVTRKLNHSLSGFKYT